MGLEAGMKSQGALADRGATWDGGGGGSQLAGREGSLSVGKRQFNDTSRDRPTWLAVHCEADTTRSSAVQGGSERSHARHVSRLASTHSHATWSGRGG